MGDQLGRSWLSFSPFIPRVGDRRLPEPLNDRFPTHTASYGRKVLKSERFLTLAGDPVTLFALVVIENGMPHKQHQRHQRQEVNPQTALGEESLLQFEANDRENLCQPHSLHTVAPSVPIKYSYTGLTSSSAGITDSTSIPF